MSLNPRLVFSLLAAIALLVPALAHAQRAAAGGGHTLVVATDGTVWAWGENSWGQLGDGTQNNRKVPVQVSGLTNVTAVAAGSTHSLALRSDGTVWAWGINFSGELGLGDTLRRLTPTQITSLTGVTAISSGYNHNLAVRGDGTLWAWGGNSWGQLGQGNTTGSTVPIQVSSLTAMSAVAAGNNFSLAVKSDGTIWSWGANWDGALGDGSATNRLAPVQVSGITTGAFVAAGGYHSLAVLADGTLKAWGANSSGQLGDGTTTRRLTPVAIAGVTGVSTVAAGSTHSLARKTDGALLAWGANGYGQLATGTTSSQSSPAVIAAITGAAAVDGGDNHTVVVTTGGVVFTAGRNASGQLGDGTAVDRAAATAISEADLTWKVTTPTFNYNPGTYYQPINVTITTETTGTTIRYTLDGSEPTEASPAATGPVPVSANGVLKAKAWHPTRPASNTGAVSFTFAALSPTFTPGSGTFASPQAVTLSTTTAGATIRYTIDGTNPTAASTPYTAPITVDRPLTIKAIAFRDGWTQSTISSAGYSFSNYQATAPASVAAGTYHQPISVVLGPPPANLSIEWSTDPNQTVWWLYQYPNPIIISKTTTLRWRVVGYQPNGAYYVGGISTRTYVLKVADPVVTRGVGGGGTGGPAPGQSLPSGEYEPGTVIQITSETPGAVFYYRLDGQPPTTSDPVVPAGGRLMVGNFALTLMGASGQMDPSDVVAAEYSIPWNYNNGALVGGGSHSVALLPDGTVWTWGRNNLRQLGYGESTSGTLLVEQALTPRNAGVTGVTAIAAGFDFTMALRHDETVWTWGHGTGSQLGRTGCTFPSTYMTCVRPESVGLTNITAIAAGRSHALALDRDGFVWSWGDNDAGQLGDGTTTGRWEARLVPSLTNVVEIAAGQRFSYARRADGTVWAWGTNDNAQIGDGTMGWPGRLSPVQIPSLTNIQALGAGLFNGYARQADNLLWIWGHGGSGQLGFNSYTYTPGYVPAVHTALGPLAGMTGGDTHTVALQATGAVATWGGNQYGQLGDGSTSVRPTPATVAGLPEIRAVGAGMARSFAIGRNGSGWAWGANAYGQAGNGGTVPVLTPVEIIPAPRLNGCTLSRVTPGTIAVPAEGGSEAFTVKIAPVCAWTVTSDSAFAHPGPGRTGSGTIVVTFDVNPGPSRTATLTFPGGTVTVTQAGGAVVAPTNEEISYFHTDAIGSVRMITNEAGVDIARYDYVPFGARAPESPIVTSDNRVLFTGQERDFETGFGDWQAFDYFGARSFQSQTGRFTRADDPGYGDPLDPQSMNLYAYAFNNPLRYVDPTGHDGECPATTDPNHVCVSAPLPPDIGLINFILDPLIGGGAQRQPSPEPLTPVAAPHHGISTAACMAQNYGVAWRSTNQFFSAAWVSLLGRRWAR